MLNNIFKTVVFSYDLHIYVETIEIKNTLQEWIYVPINIESVSHI